MLSSLSFVSPSRLLLLLAVLAVAVAGVVAALRGRRDRGRFASPQMQASVMPVSPGWRRTVPAVVLLLGLTLATVGFARPQVLADQARDRSIVLVTLDTSTSMLADDVQPTRIRAAVAAAQEFVRGLPPQVDVGLVFYNANVRLVTAPTPQHEKVAKALPRYFLAGGTALGEAVLTGLSTLPPEFRRSADGGPPAARVVVLSDGGSTTGRPVSDAVAQAQEYGVPVSTIAYGTDAGVVVQDGRSYPVPVDTALLTQLADGTGGTAYRAADAGQLAAVYQDIGTRVARETARRELTAPVAGLAAGLVVLAALGSLLGTGRLA
ncbi:MAG: von Willebrand factor type [Frankiales bacterium]|nr:von Willebrand factor type [Frankiales bacterium]